MENSKPAHARKTDSLLHIVMGCVILLHGIERLEKHFYSGMTFILAGIVFLSCAIFHKRLIKHFRFLDIFFHSLEGLLAFVVAVEYFQENKKYIPYFYILAGMFYLLAAFFQYNRNKKNVKPAL